MFGFSSRTPEKQCGVVIDIGSGSVGVAIVYSDNAADKPEIIWSHRERVLIHDIMSTEVPLKEIITSVLNVFLHLGSDGMKAVYAHERKINISTVQVSISAPWTYTITKTINFSSKQPFEVDDAFVKELSDTAKKQAITTILENQILQESQLEIIDNTTISTAVNGYPIEVYDDIKTTEVTLEHITAITQKKILTVLKESQEKVLPETSLATHSFMYLYYDVLKHLKPDTSEICLIDVTSEATEIGIVRDGTLSHVTHTAFGTFSIAREISAMCKIPKEEAYTYLKGGTSFVETKLPTEKMAELDVMIEAYEDKIAELFKLTGDALAIPKTLFLHTEVATEAFFVKRLQNAAKKATSMKHTVHPVTSLLFEETTQGDTGILLSAHYFHRKHRDLLKMDT